MRDKRGTTLSQLREAVDCLPRTTRLAMLEGINRNPIIVGAYTDSAGICPMLAAHRAGGRTSFIGFAKAWDGFAFRGSRRHDARPATERELLVLRTYLEASLLADECPDQDLRAAVAEHRTLTERRRAETVSEPPEHTRPGDPELGHELRHRPGWRWMRIVRTVDDYERLLAALEREAGSTTRAAQPAPRPVPSA